MADEKTIHEDNDTPNATDDNIQRADKDTLGQGDARPGASVDEGLGATPASTTDPDENEDPKSGHSPV